MNMSNLSHAHGCITVITFPNNISGKEICNQTKSIKKENKYCSGAGTQEAE